MEENLILENHNSAELLDILRQTKEPYQITIDDITYTQIPDKDNYQASDTLDIVTPINILRRHFNPYYAADQCQGSSLPPFLKNLSLAHRRRFYFQAYYKQYGANAIPNVEKLVDFFNHYQEYTLTKNSWLQDYTACLYATDNSPQAAAQLLTRHGTTSGKRCLWDGTDCTKIALFDIKPKPDDSGVTLRLMDSISLKDHLFSVLNTLYLGYTNKRIRKDILTPDDCSELLKMAFSDLYQYNGYFFSFPQRHIISMHSIILKYSGYWMRGFKENNLLPPLYDKLDFDEPTEEDWILEYEGDSHVDINFTDFKFQFLDKAIQSLGAEASAKQSNLNALYRHYYEYLDAGGAPLKPDTPYHRSIVLQFLHPTQFTNAKKFGHINQAAQRGFWTLDFLKYDQIAEEIKEGAERVQSYS